MSVGPRLEKFNIVSNDHGRTQKCDFCVSVGKTNFIDHHTTDTMNGFRDSVLVCKMHDCYCTIRKNFEHFHSYQALKTNHFKMLLKVFSTTKDVKEWHYIYLPKLYSILIILLLKNNLINICSKIIKIGKNLWMV